MNYKKELLKLLADNECVNLQSSQYYHNGLSFYVMTVIRSKNEVYISYLSADGLCSFYNKVENANEGVAAVALLYIKEMKNNQV